MAGDRRKRCLERAPEQSGPVAGRFARIDDLEL